MRHGEAGKSLSVRSKDIERSLTAEGKEELEEVARALSRLKVRPDHIVSSPMKRARETASITAKTLKKRDTVEIWDELKPEGSKQEFYKRLSKMKPESSVLCVGHEPYLTQMINEVMGHQGPSRIVLRKSGVARLSIRAFTPKVEGELRWLLTPRLLKRMS
ncbi:MAG TPA: phosphohistidine phosphatase SixA [Nitrososphaerales archaeon]|nr:phosphohistidine phosphatase SixA [Nitrososphaerales archaeon]